MQFIISIKLHYGLFFYSLTLRLLCSAVMLLWVKLEVNNTIVLARKTEGGIFLNYN